MRRSSRSSTATTSRSPTSSRRTLGHFADFRVAFVQTPQYYANGARARSPAAGAQQTSSSAPIARGKDGLGSIFCCGTNVIFRRDALEEVGGFPEDTVTEDFELSISPPRARLGMRLRAARCWLSGLGPEDMASYVCQQQRWARGCLSALPRRPPRPAAADACGSQYLLSSIYFLSGWTLLVYMSLPGDPDPHRRAAARGLDADQFLLHFAPYFCAALATVALAGAGTYTFAPSRSRRRRFWIHMQATMKALLRRHGRFVVTPKQGDGRAPAARGGAGR